MGKNPMYTLFLLRCRCKAVNFLAFSFLLHYVPGKVINLEQLHDIVYEAGNCFETCNGIIKVANALGGPDNISVCVSYLRT